MIKQHLIKNQTTPPKKTMSIDRLQEIILIQKYFQANLLYVPSDKFGYTVNNTEDVFDSKCDAEPFKHKTASSIVNSFQKIYSMKVLKIPRNNSIRDLKMKQIIFYKNKFKMQKNFKKTV